MNKINVCIAGLGNVGSHLVKSIQENRKFIATKAGIEINILGVSAKDISKKRICDIANYQWFQDPNDLINVKDCNVIIELIGEESGVSFDLIKKALQNKIHIVTANKALLAKNGMELFKLAEDNNVLLLYEAAVAGGIPIIKTLKNNIFLNKVKKISGILNGTTNYILTEMYEKNLDFDEILSIAKSKGYTSESEAQLDIGGLDSAHKLTLLSSLSFGSEINFANNYTHGISNIKIDDINNADKLGYKIKLISEALIIDNKIYSVTEPKLINKNNPLSNVNGVLNAINIETDQLKSLFLEGEGAGGKATASSVISDLYEITSNSNILSLGFNTKSLINYEKIDITNIENSYYIRIMTKDISGVLSKITGYFDNFNISIKKIIQIPENNTNKESVPIIIITHLIKKNKLIEAIKKIENQEFTIEKIISIPIVTI